MEKTYQIDPSPNSRIVRSAIDEVKAIQTLLADSYKDLGDGRTLLRELVQNADDAAAERLVFSVVETGLPDAQNSLLRGPALLVANSGPFPARDRNALHQALGGSKAEDADKVGRFGIGLKSVFHICEAIVYVGADEDTIRPGALNPWAGTGASGDVDPLHPDWDSVGDTDLQYLLAAARKLLGEFRNGLLLWIPLRQPIHLDRAQGRQYGLGQACPITDSIVAWFKRSTSLALLLAQCGHIASIEAYYAQNITSLDKRERLVRVVRPEFQSLCWVGRYENDVDEVEKSFEGRIEDDNRGWTALGVEALGLDSLRRLRIESEWPTELCWQNGKCEWVPCKALSHAAITILQPDDLPPDQCGINLRWAVFLPLDDDPIPRQSSVVESVGNNREPGTWEIMMHGYFWPSHDRRSIPGVSDNEIGSGDSAARIRWNRAVRDELLLPLLPKALEHAVKGIPESAARSMLQVITGSQIVRGHLSDITRLNVLLPTIAENGVSWVVHPTGESHNLSIPAWNDAPGSVRAQFLSKVRTLTNGFKFIDGDAPKIGGEEGEWPLESIRCILECISSNELGTSSVLSWIEILLSKLLSSREDTSNDRASVVATWLAERIGDGILSTSILGSSQEEREDMRTAWLRVFAKLPRNWLVLSPVDAQNAVVELAKEGIIGPGLLTIPFGRSTDQGWSPTPDPDRLDSALLKLGKNLRDDRDSSQRLYQSRLLLAETLLSVREALPLNEELRALPLLRARRMPDDKDEAWSMDELYRRAEQIQVFSKPTSEDDRTALEIPYDPKQAVLDLAKALEEDVWLVDSALTSIANLAVATPEALAKAVLVKTCIQSKPMNRKDLVQRLAKSENVGLPVIHQAITSLLTGRVPKQGYEEDLYYVRSQDYNRLDNTLVLRVLLKLLGRPWREVDAGLVEPIQLSLVDDLHIKAVDFGILHELLQECIDESVEWTNLETGEVTHLLRQLHNVMSPYRDRWRQMPLHRGVGGSRGCFDERALKAVGGLALPRELESEIRLLQPEKDVEDLYRDVPSLDPEGVLHAMLVSQRPYRFAKDIVKSIRPGTDVHLPRNIETGALLKSAKWLPTKGYESGFSPNTVLLLSGELQIVVSPLARAGALASYRLSEDVDPEVWSFSEDVIRKILGEPGVSRQIQNLAKAIDTAQVPDLDDGAYILLPDPDLITASLISGVMQSSLADAHEGWALVRSAINAAGIDHLKLSDTSSSQTQSAVVGLAQSLCGPMPPERQTYALSTLAASRPPKDSSAGVLFREFMDAFVHIPGFYERVLPNIELPTQGGQWHHTRDIARSSSGVSRRHLLLQDLRLTLGLDKDEPVHGEVSTTSVGSGTADTLNKYFDPWADRIPEAAVGAFIGLLGNGLHEAILDLAQDWIGEDVSVERMRQELHGEINRDPCAGVRVYVQNRIAQGQKVEALNLLGERVEMDAGSDSNTIFAVDPIRRSSDLGGFWEITLRDVNPSSKTAHELIALLGGTVEWWAVRVLRIDIQAVRSWWSRWGTGSQAQVGPVQASILAHLPLTLHQLDVSECASLQEALRNAQRAQRRREQAPAAQISEANEIERKVLDQLASLIRDNQEHQRFIWMRVQSLIERYGYREDSILLELAQNADDALSQSAEMKRSELPDAARRLIIHSSLQSDVPTLDVIHYGRPINETGGAAFPEGQTRQWDQDLYFMMLLNLSGKPGEVSGQNAVASTTGRFGLGFKSVHLVSETPSVVSGFLAFTIAGGLLPIEQPTPQDPDLAPVEGHQTTRIRLPLRCDVEAPDLIDKMFKRFSYARVLLPAFAREIREIIVDGGPSAGVSSFEGKNVPGATGWSITSNTVGIPGKGQWRLLRFRPADAGIRLGTEALVVGIRDGVPQKLPPEIPFLWNVAPTSEGWGCGYAVNGPFKLDPGRTHVSLDDPATLSVVNLLGETLGRGLIELHDMLLSQSATLPDGLPSRENVGAFISSLWMVLASGIDNNDALRNTLLRCLQGSGRGISAWMSSRSVVPSGLPAPFATRLPALEPTTPVEAAAGGLIKGALCKALAQIEDIKVITQRHLIVSPEIAGLLRPLLGIRLREVKPSDLLHELTQHWDHVLTPERLHVLRSLCEEDIWQETKDNDQRTLWSASLVARSKSGNKVPLSRLLLPRNLTIPVTDTAVDEELRRSAFAPDEALLEENYIVAPEDVTMFLRLRERHEIDASILTSWYQDVVPDLRPAALSYLLRGRLQNEVLERLIPKKGRPSWLEDYEAVRLMIKHLGEEQWRSDRLLAALFPDRFRDSQEAVDLEESYPEHKRQRFFELLKEWWDDPAIRRDVINSYEKKAWPAWLREAGIADGLRSESRDHWLGVLVLGACRSLGRFHAGQHRSFLEMAHSEGWWDVFKNPEDREAWMDILRTWQDTAVSGLSYQSWMSLFPAIYQLSRYLEKYRRLLLSAVRRPAEMFKIACILAPRVDEALSGAGYHFDAPPAPLNMGLHWVLRELVRFGLIDGYHIFAYCWVPSEQVLSFLRPLGLSIQDNTMSNPDKAKAVFHFLADQMGTEKPHLHRAFDIPMRHIDENPGLRKQLGLEE